MISLNDQSVTFSPPDNLPEVVRETDISPNELNIVTCDRAKDAFLKLKQLITIALKNFEQSGSSGETPLESFVGGNMGVAYAYYVWKKVNDSSPMPIPTFMLRTLPTGIELGYGPVQTLEQAAAAFNAQRAEKPQTKKQRTGSRTGSQKTSVFEDQVSKVLDAMAVLPEPVTAQQTPAAVAASAAAAHGDIELKFRAEMTAFDEDDQSPEAVRRRAILKRLANLGNDLLEAYIQAADV
jgi:hypothetical protein